MAYFDSAVFSGAIKSKVVRNAGSAEIKLAGVAVCKYRFCYTQLQ